MNTYITTSTTTTTGYELRIAHNDGTVDVLPIEKTALEKKTGINWLVLPENPTNRKLLNPKKMEGKTSLELSIKEPGRTGTNITPTTTKKGIEEYLTEDELKVWNELKAKAEFRANLAKAKAVAEAAQAEYERLLAEAQA